jgi:hypothetical protein
MNFTILFESPPPGDLGGWTFGAAKLCMNNLESLNLMTLPHTLGVGDLIFADDRH